MLNDGEKGAIIQRDRETYAIAPHIPCGIVTPEMLRKIADVAEKYNAKELKITSAARITIIGIKEEDIDNIWSDLEMTPGAAVGLCVRSVKACPGTTYCKRAQQDSLGMGMYLDKKYHGMILPGKLKFGVAGCGNKCAEIPIKDIGLMGTQKGWDLYAGGCGGGLPRLADRIARGLTDDEAKKLIAEIIKYYKAEARKHERMGKFINRIGLEEFIKAINADKYTTS